MFCALLCDPLHFPRFVFYPVTRKVLGLLLVVLGAVLGLSGTTVSEEDDKVRPPVRPNILFILVDDMGKDAVRWYPTGQGRKAITPNLDELAAEGLVFENAWTNPVCSPTRATLLTGRYGFRTGVQHIVPYERFEGGIKTSEISVQRMLDQRTDSAYDHAVIGKWHLSDQTNGDWVNAGKMGVGHFDGMQGGSLKNLYSWTRIKDGVGSLDNRYITTALTDESITWINERQRPWFLWLAEYAPHSPHVKPPDSLLSAATVERLTHAQDTVDLYMAAIEAMDHEVGRLLASLSPETRANTIIIFMADNGSAQDVALPPFDRYRAKRSLYVGGVDVPMIAAGPGVRVGRTSTFVNSTDLFATVLELAGVDLPVYQDSRSFAPILFKKRMKDPREFLFAEMKERDPMDGRTGYAYREGDFVLVNTVGRGDELFDLSTDPYQMNDLLGGQDAARYAAQAMQLKAQVEKLRTQPVSAQ